MARITIDLWQALDCVKNDTVIVGATIRVDAVDAFLGQFTMSHEVLMLSDQTETMIRSFLNDVNVS